MLKNKRILVFMVVVLSVFALSACSTGTTDKSSTDKSSSGSSVVADAVNSFYANMPDDINKIDQVAFVDKVKAGDSMTILDIRSADAYAEGHIKGAISMPWGPKLADDLTKIPNDKPVMIYCVTGQTAGQTVALLNIAGFDAKSVNLGWNLGISKVEGVDAVIDKTPTEFDASVNTKIDPDIKKAIEDYYAGLETATNKNYKISEDDAKKALDEKNATVAFLDVRKADDYAKGHIEGAVNIPFGKGMEEQFGTLPMDKTIIVYCYTGQTAGQTVAGLRLLGYDAVSLNSGTGTAATGTSGWTNKGYPLVTN